MSKVRTSMAQSFERLEDGGASRKNFAKSATGLPRRAHMPRARGRGGDVCGGGAVGTAHCKALPRTYRRGECECVARVCPGFVTAAGRPQVRAEVANLSRFERWAACSRRARSSKMGERDVHPRASAGGSGAGFGGSGATGDAILSAYQVGLGRIAVSDIELPYLSRTGIPWLNGGATRQYDRTLLQGEGAAGDRQRERRVV